MSVYFRFEHEFGQTLANSGGQGSLKCYGPLSCEVRHDFVTEQKVFQMTSLSTRNNILEMILFQQEIFQKWPYRIYVVEDAVKLMFKLSILLHLSKKQNMCQLKFKIQYFQMFSSIIWELASGQRKWSQVSNTVVK